MKQRRQASKFKTPGIENSLLVNEINKHLSYRKRPDVYFDIEVVDKEKMAKLNKKYMGKTGPTDVLSFPLEKIPGEKKAFIGTIIICSDIIEKVAKENKTNYADEFMFRIRHGIDHLIGIHH